ncbi:MAG: DUF4166 domain-containing protein [Tardiphaga sp.]
MSAPELEQPAPPRAVLLVGATGAFGERLAEGLVRSGIAVIAVARSRPPLLRLAERLGPLVTIEQRTRDSIDAACLRTLSDRFPNLFAVADASGPFQTSDHALPRAAIAAGLHYVDLADARLFVRSITALDGDARDADVAVMSGASSTPALSHAVLDTLVTDVRGIIAIDVSIAPGNRAPCGLSVVRSILSTVGQPIRAFYGGRWTDIPGWTLGRTITLPGAGVRRVTLCETPDLDLLVSRYRPASDALFRAGLELRLLQDGTAALGLLVRCGLIRTLVPLAAPLRAMADLLKPFGSDTGGMQVAALVERADGAVLRRVWSLTATAGVGPHIPTLPALAALKALADGTLSWRGAAPCAGLLHYNAIAREFAPHAITIDRQETTIPPSQMQRLLGARYDALPSVLRHAHDVRHVNVLAGHADVTGPHGLGPRLVAWLFRLPRHGINLPLRVEMRREENGSETWSRIYPDVTMRSTLRNADPDTLQLDECFGPISIRLQWQATDSGLALQAVGARLFGIPLPRFLQPRSQATETVGSNGQFHFDVDIAMPLIGPIVSYRGDLSLLETSDDGAPAM